MILEALLLSLELLLECSTFGLHVCDLIMLCVNFALPFTLYRSHLFFFGSKLLLKRVELLLKLAILFLDLVNVLLQSGSFIVQDCFSLLDFLHIVLHLALKVIL